MLQVHWTISFRSFKTNTLYTISILDDSYAGSPIPLIGGADPISTKEVDDEDVFTPIRTQSGYIRIVDNGKDANGNTFDWHDLIPATATSRPITLTHTENNTTVIDWAGFIQPQTFKCDFGEYVAEREFPICDELSLFEGLKVEPTNNDYQLFSFAYLISHFFYKLPWHWHNFHFCGGDESVAWLTRSISWSQMAEVDVYKNIVSKYNCKEILEEVCKVFGWTCRQQGYDIYFDSATDSAMRKWITLNDQDLEDVIREDEMSKTEHNETILQGLPGHFVSTKNEISIIRGWHKSTVEAKVNKIDSVLEYPKDEISDYYHSSVINRTRPIDTNGLWLFEKQPITSDQQYTFRNVTMETISYQILGPAPDYPVPAYGAIHIYTYSNTENPHALDLKNSLVILRSAQNVRPLFKMRSRQPFYFNDGIIVVSAKVFTDFIQKYQTPSSYNPYNAKGTLIGTLKVGNTHLGFTVFTGSENGRYEHGEGQIQDDKRWNDGYPDYNGTKIPVTGGVGGYIELTIEEFVDGSLSPDDYKIYQARECNIVDFKLEFLRKDSDELLKDDDKNRYVNESTSPFTEEKEVSLMFFTDNNNQYAENVIFNADGSYCTTMTIAGENVHPEQHLVDRMAAWGGVTHEVMEVETDTTNNAASVTPECVIEYNGKRYSPISISRNWRDDTIKFKYIELLTTQTNS